MRERAGWIVAAVLLVSSFLSAQSMTGWFQQTIQVQQERLELLKSVQPEESMLRGYLDRATQLRSVNNEEQLHIEGWNFECVGGVGHLDVYKVDLHMNGFRKDITEFITRATRIDVPQNVGLSSWCPIYIPENTGIDAYVPMGQLLPGWYNIALEFWTFDGRNYTTEPLWMRLY